MEIYDPAGGLGAARRPFNRTIARVTELRLAGGVVRREATTNPMMQRIQGAFGSSLLRSDGLATGIAPLVAVLILPRSGLRFGYTTRRRDCRCRPRKFPRRPPRINHKDFKWLIAQTQPKPRL